MVQVNTGKIKQFWGNNKQTILVVGAASLLTFALLAVRAGSPFAGFEGEGASLYGSVVVKSTGEASGGKYVEFIQNISSSFKPFASGLVVTDPSVSKRYDSEFATIKTVYWKDVETQPGSYDWSTIDSEIASSSEDLKFRIRLYAGRFSPRWLDDISGSCIEITPDSPNGASGCVPRFWTDEYIDRYEQLMDSFAERYEQNPRVVDVINSACTTIFAEPFILGADATSRQRLWNAGLTKDGHEKCLQRSMSKMMDVFPTTRVTIAGHNKWQLLAEGSSPETTILTPSWEAERTLLNRWRAEYGQHLVVEEHGLGPNDFCDPGSDLATAESFYCWFASDTGPKGLQFTLNGGSMFDAALNGVNMGSCFLEFAAFEALSEVQRTVISEQLVGNCS